AAVWNGGCRDVDLVQPLNEVRDVLLFSGRQNEWFLRVSVGSGRDENYFWFEAKQFIERAFYNIDMFFPRRFGRDWIIVDVSKRFRTGSGVGGELMDRCELDPGIVRDNGFGPVPVMRIEIPNRHALSAVLERVKRRDGDIAEVTKTHRAIARGVMSWARIFDAIRIVKNDHRKNWEFTDATVLRRGGCCISNIESTGD